jgi:N-acyl amino acid synthase of PEP-CTERM/exosortase system
MFIQMLLGKRDLFVPYFKFRIVNHRIPDENLLEEIFKLRYEVYCLERHFLPEEEFRDGLEHDDYDECSTHVAAFTHEDQVIGTVRLVQPSISQPYPFEAHCSIFEHFEMPDRSMAGEVSRLVVKKNYRRRRGDSMEGVSAEFIEKGDARISKLKRNGRESNSPLLLLGLYHEIYRYSRKNGIRYLYAAMERSLARCLNRMGFSFVPIGPQTDYYGPVTPFILDLNELDKRLNAENKLLAAWFTDKPLPRTFVLKTLFRHLRNDLSFWEHQ